MSALKETSMLLHIIATLCLANLPAENLEEVTEDTAEILFYEQEENAEEVALNEESVDYQDLIFFEEDSSPAEDSFVVTEEE